ncbi:uncharacterized protein MYCFIDRAFT_64317 [Pseudocercospora fijiensis CIRAD86]|uniref:ADP-ribosylglycohydrolase n=1 Tax=Pseudocercospora fijiensis (strain CIRAD86) TaxID=383855 RepID=M3ALM2_PSEFD|nr:uncharacterized protein MYCFIDRAFT_64317 [Pseudocercospora fijiensis CIRAD86]EME78342.1 hypothetical protein MYCFIDRAFT_64317 [Pseudocercospora fijiensis CIRAD86]
MEVACVVVDDDISGTFTFVRALEEHGYRILTEEEVGRTWLNSVIERRTVFWWGGNGVSTEHTAYTNLKHKGLRAPDSGSMQTNSKTIAEQIGAQIFIDGWAMVAPGNPALAAQLAEAAARVSHDGEAVYAAKLWAAMEAQAFISRDIIELLDLGLSFIPTDSLVAKLIHDVRTWCRKNSDWLVITRQRIEDEYGDEEFGGVCHVIPNHGVMIMALIYGGQDFSKAMLHIVNTCGWDTDCNSGNVGCLVAIMHGMGAFDGEHDWRGPIADLALISSADGGYGINNAARIAYDIAASGYRLAGEQPPYKTPMAQYQFALPGSVQGFRACQASKGDVTVRQITRHEQGVLEICMNSFSEPVYISTPTFIPAEVLKVSRTYDMVASPLLYPGQILRAKLSVPQSKDLNFNVGFRLMVYDSNDRLVEVDSDSTAALCAESNPAELSWKIPFELISLFSKLEFWSHHSLARLRTSVDKFYTSLGPSSFYLSQDQGEGLIIHGTREWKDYAVSVRKFAVHLGQPAGVVVRVQGLRRWYALLFLPGKVAIVKARDDERENLAIAKFDWQVDFKYEVQVSVEGDEITGKIGEVVISAKDDEYGGGGGGLIVAEGALSADSIDVQPI